MATRVTYDDFTRADGVLGGSWAGTTTWYDILTNRCRVRSTTETILRHTVTAGAPDMHVELTIHSTTTYGNNGLACVWVRKNASDTSGYGLKLTLSSLTLSELSLYRVSVALGSAELAMVRVPSLTAGDHVLSLTIVGDLITAMIDGTTWIELQNTDVTAGDYAGMSGLANLNEFYSLFEVYDTGRAAMSLSPTVVLAGIDGQLIGVYGYGTQWTPGTPGDPEFTASNGSIVAQTIYTVDRAGITYDPPDDETVVVITDPNYGRSAYLRVQYQLVAPPGFPPDVFGIVGFLNQMSRDLTDLLNAAALALTDGLSLPEGESVLGWVREIGEPPEGENLSSLLVEIRRELMEDADDPTTIRSVLVDLFAELYALDGYPNRVTTTDLLTAIGEGGGGGSAEVLEAIEALSTLVTEVLTETYLIDGFPNRHSLQDILDAIDALTIPDITQLAADVAATLAKVDALDGDGSTTLPAILGETQAAHSDASAAAISANAAAISAAAATVAVALSQGVVLAAITAAVLEINAATALEVTAISGEITTVGVVLGGKIDDVSDQVADLDEKIVAVGAQLERIEATVARIETATRRYTIRADVTIMNTYFVTSPTEVPGPMNGIFLTVTQNRSGTTYWAVGTHTNLRWSGFVAFVGDDGRMDERQPVAFSHQVYMPKTMAVAAYCVVWIPAGTQVTIEPWYWAPP